METWLTWKKLPEVAVTLTVYPPPPPLVSPFPYVGSWMLTTDLWSAEIIATTAAKSISMNKILG